MENNRMGNKRIAIVIERQTAGKSLLLFQTTTTTTTKKIYKRDIEEPKEGIRFPLNRNYIM